MLRKPYIIWPLSVTFYHSLFLSIYFNHNKFLAITQTYQHVLYAVSSAWKDIPQDNSMAHFHYLLRWLDHLSLLPIYHFLPFCLASFFFRQLALLSSISYNTLIVNLLISCSYYQHKSCARTSIAVTGVPGTYKLLNICLM